MLQPRPTCQHRSCSCSGSCWSGYWQCESPRSAAYVIAHRLCCSADGFDVCPDKCSLQGWQMHAYCTASTT
jgi:hypothetical protein